VIGFLIEYFLEEYVLTINKLYHVISEFGKPFGWATYPGNAIPTAGTPMPPGCCAPNCITTKNPNKITKKKTHPNKNQSKKTRKKKRRKFEHGDI